MKKIDTRGVGVWGGWISHSPWPMCNESSIARNGRRDRICVFQSTPIVSKCVLSVGNGFFSYHRLWSNKLVSKAYENNSETVRDSRVNGGEQLLFPCQPPPVSNLFHPHANLPILKHNGPIVNCVPPPATSQTAYTHTPPPILPPLRLTREIYKLN